MSSLYTCITIYYIAICYITCHRLTFAAARYTGNIINDSIYEMLIHMKAMPFLEESLKSFGLLNYHPVHEIMSRPVVVINELSRVGAVYEVLKNTTHNGFPVLNKGTYILFSSAYICITVLTILLFYYITCSPYYVCRWPPKRPDPAQDSMYFTQIQSFLLCYYHYCCDRRGSEL